MIDIQKATPGDAATIQALGIQTFKDNFGYQFATENLEKYLLQAYDIREIRKSLLDENNIFWIAYVNRTPVGYSKIKMNSYADGIYVQKQIQLEKIYVLEKFIGTKVGSSLMNLIINDACTANDALIWLIVSESNNRAIKFYEQYGFILHSWYDYTVGDQISKCILMMRSGTRKAEVAGR